MGSQFPSKKLQIEVRSLYGRYNLTYLCSFQAQKAKAGASKVLCFEASGEFHEILVDSKREVLIIDLSSFPM